MAQAIIVMGVSGSGKTTIGRMLARELDWDFFDGDDFHPPKKREKMSKGIPLTDEDRVEWLNHLRELIQNHLTEGSSLVLACSALKERYREKLAANDKVRFVFLRGTYDQVEPRLKRRKGHYMPVQLLQSQFEALEEPRDAVTVEVTHTPAEIIRLIRRGIGT